MQYKKSVDGVISDMTPKEIERLEGLKNDPVIAAKEVRSIRDKLLSRTDWTQASDNPKKGNSEIVAYRQALRDITDQAEFPFNIVWPEPPDGINV